MPVKWLSYRAQSGALKKGWNTTHSHSVPLCCCITTRGLNFRWIHVVLEASLFILTPVFSSFCRTPLQFLDEMATVGDIFDIADILRRAWDLYRGCLDAASEMKDAASHIHHMTVVLQDIHVAISTNRMPFIHLQHDQAKTRTHSLKANIKLCEKSLVKMGRLLDKYRSQGRHSISRWDQLRWSDHGKKELTDAKADMIFATTVLNTSLQTANIDSLSRLEDMISAIGRKLALCEIVESKGSTRKASDDGDKDAIPKGIVFASLVITKLRNMLHSIRIRKAITANTVARLQKTLDNIRVRRIVRRNTPTAIDTHAMIAGTPGKHPGPRARKCLSRTNSGFESGKIKSPSRKRLPNQLANQPTRPKQAVRARTPSPDPSQFSPRPIRRVGTARRIAAQINAKAADLPHTTAFYQLWVVKSGSLMYFKSVPKWDPCKRGQLQIRNMARIFKEANQTDRECRALEKKDKRVSLKLKDLNDIERKKDRGLKWHFVVGRVMVREPGNVIAEKSFLIFVRR
ncbi:hypothetical protein BS50DRAFT_360249 [Corynespora cassiicola Philippines]|uniref:Fungal N-terminal domain-containing protein n=1 Tax=Corynespora cassiicola Philippines TaxID=1448308 RepID=A0A2T2NS91_CORCC|nr:hypothetical protein BS50DRAFT_360249 [Corynespora cassiicola Philippines]